VQRPDELDESALERALGPFMARHVGPGIAADVRMFTDLFRIVAEHELSVPPEIAGAFRALATIEGTLTQVTPGFDILVQTRSFATDYFAEQLSAEALRERRRLGFNVRLLADEGDRRYLTGLVHQRAGARVPTRRRLGSSTRRR
jgi:ubiquinone biosynthesis protein